MKQIKKTKLVITSIVIFGLLMTTTVYAYENNLWQGSVAGEGMGHKLGNKHFGPGLKLEIQSAELKTKIFAAQAELLDLSVDELKAALDSGQKLPELVKDAGFTLPEFHEKMAERRKAIGTAHLQDLLSQGKITQEEYDKLLEKIENGKMIGNKVGQPFEGIKSSLQELVDEGVITVDQLTKILERIEKNGNNGNKVGKFIGNSGHGLFEGAIGLGLN